MAQDQRKARRSYTIAAAWDFVLATTIVPLSPATYAVMLRCLDSYLYRATHRRRRLVVPEPGHRFWTTYERVRLAAGMGQT